MHELDDDVAHSHDGPLILLEWSPDRSTTPPNSEDRGPRLRKKLPGSSASRAAKQQAGANPVTAGAIGSGSAALVGSPGLLLASCLRGIFTITIDPATNANSPWASSWTGRLGSRI